MGRKASPGLLFPAGRYILDEIGYWRDLVENLIGPDVKRKKLFRSFLFMDITCHQEEFTGLISSGPFSFLVYLSFVFLLSFFQSFLNS
jgi:hypothetical protein